METIELILANDVPNVGKQGQRVSLALTPTDVHLAEEMATYLAGYSVPNFRADEASGVILVDKDEDWFRTFDTDDAFKRVEVKASIQAPVPEVDPKTALTKYSVIDRFVGAFVPTVTELNAVKAFRPKQAGLNRCKRAIQLDREYDTWGLLTTTGNWNANNVIALGGTANWNGGASSNPIKDLMDLGERSAMAPIEYWMPPPAANAFIRHSLVKDHYRQFLGDGAIGGTLNDLNRASAANTSMDFAIPGVGIVHVVAGKAKDAAGALGYILGQSFVVATHSPPGVPTDGEDVATSYTFRRKGPSGTGFETREFFIENRGPLGGTMVVTSMADVAKMTGNIVGGLLTGVVT